MFLGDAAGEGQLIEPRRLITDPALGGRQAPIREQREQAGIGRPNRIERRAMARAAHDHESGAQAGRQLAFFLERREVVLGRDDEGPAP